MGFFQTLANHLEMISTLLANQQQYLFKKNKNVQVIIGSSVKLVAYFAAFILSHTVTPGRGIQLAQMKFELNSSQCTIIPNLFPI